MEYKRYNVSITFLHEKSGQERTGKLSIRVADAEAEFYTNYIDAAFNKAIGDFEHRIELDPNLITAITITEDKE